MKKFFAYFFALLFVCGFTSVNAIAALVSGDGTPQLVYGEKYKNTVLSLQVQDDNGEWIYQGSAVVIEKKADGTVVFLTSDHAVIKNSNDIASRFNAYRVGVGNFFTGETRSVAEFILHPNAIGGKNGFSYGIGFVDDPFLTANLEPAEFYNGTIMVGQESDLAGYGVLQMEGSTDFVFTGDLRAGSNLIANSRYANPNYIATRFFEPDVSPLGMGGTGYDSGGGLFIDDKIAGIMTFQAGGPFYGSYTYSNILDSDLIHGAIQNRSSAVPEPSSMLMVTLASAFVVTRRRRSLN